MTDFDNDELWEEMRDQYSDKLQVLVNDTVAECRRVGMSLQDVVALVMVPMICESVMACDASGLSYDRFMNLCNGIYRGLQDPIQQLKSAATRKVH